MVAFFGFPPLGLLILPAVVAVAIALWLGRRGILRRGRRPRPRHIVVRVVCGILGAAILGAIAVGTWREVQRCYPAEEPAEPLTVRVPTLPPPGPTGTLKINERAEIEKARLLFTFVVAEFEAGELRPVAVGQQEVRWPEDRNRDFRKELQVGGSSAFFRFHFDSLRWSTSPREGTHQAVVWCRGQRELGSVTRPHGGSSMNSMGGDFELNQPWHIFNPIVSFFLWEKPPLSIASGPGSGPAALLQLAWGVCVAEGDPLKEAEATEFLRQHEAEVSEARRDALRGGVGPNLRLGMRNADERAPALGLALAAHIGISSLLLFVAALLLTQVFTRRSLAFVGVLAAVVLYVAALDRIALGTHLAHLRDAKAPLAARITACWHATDSFFYRKTALASVRAVADDPQAPSALRDVATEAAQVLSGAP